MRRTRSSSAGSVFTTDVPRLAMPAEWTRMSTAAEIVEDGPGHGLVLFQDVDRRPVGHGPPAQRLDGLHRLSAASASRR